MIDFRRMLPVLVEGGVRFVVVGGVAANAHGSARVTNDIDIVYDRRPDNLEKLAEALAPYHPYLRGAPPGLPFRLDADTLRRGLNFTLTSDLGPIDLLGEMLGVGGYDDVVDDAETWEPFGYKIEIVSLRKLIAAKRAAGRPKDFEAIAELEILLELKSNG